MVGILQNADPVALRFLGWEIEPSLVVPDIRGAGDRAAVSGENGPGPKPNGPPRRRGFGSGLPGERC